MESLSKKSSLLKNTKKSIFLIFSNNLIKVIFLVLIFGMGIIDVHAQIPKSKKKILNPKINVPVKNPRIPLSNPFDNIAYRLKNGKCYDLVLTSIKLKARNRQHSSFEVETRYGNGSLSYVNNNEIKAVFDISLGYKNTRYGTRTLHTTLRLKKSGDKVIVDIRNSQFNYLIYGAKIEKKKNGYFITVEKDDNHTTTSFTFAIYRTDCLI